MLNPIEASKILKMSPASVTRLCNSGAIAGAVNIGRNGRKFWRIPESAVKAMRKNARVETAEAPKYHKANPPDGYVSIVEASKIHGVPKKTIRNAVTQRRADVWLDPNVKRAYKSVPRSYVSSAQVAQFAETGRWRQPTRPAAKAETATAPMLPVLGGLMRDIGDIRDACNALAASQVKILEDIESMKAAWGIKG